MITDAKALQCIQSDWAAVQQMQQRMQSLVVNAFVGVNIAAEGSYANVVYNLPVLLAFDVLGRTLRQLRDEGSFACRATSLGH